MDEKEIVRIIESALFISSRPLALAELGKLISVAAPGFVEQKVKALQSSYDSMGSAIEIAEENGKYYMRIRQQYVHYVKDFSQATEIGKHALRTLAYLSKNEGIKKSDLCKRLGSSIYADIGELVEKGFVSQKKSGRSTLLSTTPKFKAYFGQGESANQNI